MSTLIILDEAGSQAFPLGTSDLNTLTIFFVKANGQ